MGGLPVEELALGLSGAGVGLIAGALVARARWLRSRLAAGRTGHEPTGEPPRSP